MTEPKYRGSRAPKYRGSTACSLYKLRAKPVGFWDGAALGVNYGWPGCKFTEDHVRLCFCEYFLRERFDIGLHGGPPAGEALSGGAAPPDGSPGAHSWRRRASTGQQSRLPLHPIVALALQPWWQCRALTLLLVPLPPVGFLFRTILWKACRRSSLVPPWTALPPEEARFLRLQGRSRCVVLLICKHI